MNSTSDNSLKETVYAIIDSRIQFIEYEQNSLLQKHITHHSLFCETHAEDYPASKKIKKLEEMINRIEQFNKTLKQLLLLRSQLRKDNTRLIFNLLTNSKYKEYSFDALKQILEKLYTIEQV